MAWYYAKNNERMGPVDDLEFDALVETGVIAPDTLVWRKGMAGWKKWSEAGPSSAAPAAPAAPVQAPAEPARPIAARAAPSEAEQKQDEAANWYYAVGQQRNGPVSRKEIGRLVASGRVGGDSLVWTPGMANWQRYDSLAHGQASPQANWGLPTCVSCGRGFAPEEMIRYEDNYVCAECKPIFFQRLREGVPLQAVPIYAEFWRRALAKIIDAFIIYMIYALFQVVIMMMMFAIVGVSDTVGSGDKPEPAFIVMMVFMYFFQIATPLVYNTLFLGKYAATPGKMALGMVAVNADWSRLSYLKAFLRTLSEFVSMMTCYLGYFIPLFDEQKRTLHDFIVNTRVIRRY